MSASHTAPLSRRDGIAEARAALFDAFDDAGRFIARIVRRDRAKMRMHAAQRRNQKLPAAWRRA